MPAPDDSISSNIAPRTVSALGPKCLGAEMSVSRPHALLQCRQSIGEESTEIINHSPGN